MSNVFVFRQLPPGVINEYYGGGGKGGSTTTSSVQIPPEVLARYNSVNAQAQTAAQQPYQAYSQDPNAFVAPLTQTQQAGIQNTNAVAGEAQPYYGAAAGLAAAGTQNVNPSALNVGQYYNPFTQAVAAPTLQALQQQQATERSNLVNPQTAASFGGDRSGVVAANLARQQALGTAQAMNPIYQQGYQNALTTAQQQQGVGLGAAQANRQNLQTSAQLLGQLGTGAQAAGLAGAQAQLGAGQQQQQTQQAGLQALYNQFQQQQGYPFQVAQFLANIAEGTGSLSGNTTTSTTQGGGGFFSDERLKENIQKIGETNDGQPIYRYNYKGDKNTQIGLLAQDVEKSHPDAVGLAGGFKTVNYKKATEDAVKKADGGEVTDAPSGLAAYGMDAPSAMLSKPAIGQDVVAGLAPPHMVTGNIPIQSSAISPAAAGILAPKATGFSPGTLEGKQAELSSLKSSLAGGLNASSAGPGYVNDQITNLNDWIAKNSSQGGLVGSQGGESFARGGFADGGYMNPALQYYAPQGGVGGLYGVQLQPGGAHQLVPAQAPQRPQQKDAAAEANQIAGLALNGSKLYDWAKPKAEELFKKDPAEVPNMGSLDDAPLPPVRPDEFLARGGVAGGRDGYAGLGYVDPNSGPYGGGGDFLSGILADQAKQPQYHEMKGGEMPRQQPQQSGLGALTQMGNLGKAGKSAYDFAAKKLSGDTALGSAAGDSVGTGAGIDAATAPSGGVIDLTTAAPGLGAAGADTAATGAGLAGAGEAAAGAGEAAAGLGAAAGAGEAAAAGSSIADFLPFLFLKTGGAVPRRHFEDGGPAEDAPVATRGNPILDKKAIAAILASGQGEPPVLAKNIPVPADETTVAPRGARDTTAAEIAPRTSVPAAGNAAPASRRASGLGALDPTNYLPEGVGSSAKDTLSSSNFWVPAIAGIGSMLASPNKTLAGAIGSGLVGGTTAFTGLQKQQADIAKSQAETRGLDVLNYQRSIQQTPAGNIAWLADGSIMLLGDYDMLSKQGKAPPLLGKIPENADTRVSQWLAEREGKKSLAPALPPALPATPVPTAPAAAPAAAPAVAPKKTTTSAPSEAPGPAAPPAVLPPEQKKAQADYDETSKDLADKERQIALNGGTAASTANDVTKRYIATVAPTANAARDSQKYLGELASNLADATKGKGLDAPGFGYSGRAQFTSALNTMSRAFGGSGDFGQGDTVDQINKKIEALQASISAAGGGQESFAALNMLRNAIANPNMSPRAYSQLTGDLLTTNQRAIDRDIHMSKYAKDSQGLLANAAQDFERTHDPAMYKRESDTIGKMILQQPDLIKDLRSGKYTSQQIDDAFAKQGLRNMSRYFVGRT